MSAPIRKFLSAHARNIFYADPVGCVYPVEVLDSVTVSQLMTERESLRNRLSAATEHGRKRLRLIRSYLTALIELKRAEYTSAAQVLCDVYTAAGRTADGIRLFTEYQAIRAGFKTDAEYV